MEEKVKRIIWIDKNINSDENQAFLEIFQGGVKEGKFYPVDSIEKAFDLIKYKREDVKLKNGGIKKNVKIFQFRLFYTIVSGSLSNEFFKEYVKTTLDYTIISANIIFCSDEAKHRKNLKDPHSQYCHSTGDRSKSLYPVNHNRSERRIDRHNPF